MKQQEKKSEAQLEKSYRGRGGPASRSSTAPSESKADERDRGRITSITIENFKGISNAVKIPIRPITLLFGKNSSGKSTVLQALHYHYFIRDIELKVQRGGERKSIEMAGGYNIDLADFCSLVHCHDKKRKIRVRITYDRKEENEENYILWEELITSWSEDSHSKLGNTHVESILLGYKIGDEEICCITSGEKPETVVGSNGKELDPISPDNIPPDSPTFGLLKKKADEFIKTTFGDKNKPLIKLDDIRHLGPFREVPDDKTSQRGDESRWEKGTGAWEALGRDDKLLKQTNNYMKEYLELRYSIKPHKKDNDKFLHKEDNDVNINIGLSDVGMGISQLIPVVIGALDNSQNFEIFAVEQPELHIHPGLQVALGDLFIDAINSNRVMLIETHSEHLLLRLLRRVHETSSTRVDTKYRLTPDDLSVVYVQPTPTGTKFTSVSVTNDGDFDEPWPEGFFEDRESELFYHA